MPKGYTPDLAHNPDAPALRRPGGFVVTPFRAWGMSEEAIEHETREDLELHGRAQPRRDRSLTTGPRAA